MDYIDFARTWVVTHAKFLLTWLITALLVITLAWIGIRCATRCATMAMTEAMVTTVAVCVPEVAAAVQSTHPGVSVSASSPGLVEAMHALGHLSADRMHWLHAVANLRLPETALPPAALDMPVHPLVCSTPRPLAEAHLAAECRFVNRARVLQAKHRALQALETAEREGSSELHHIERKTSAIVERFDQANAQSEQVDVQRLLIQKFNTLGNRERELTVQLAALRQQPGERTEALWAQSQRAADDYAAMLDPLVAVARRELGYETATDGTALWLTRTHTGQGPLCAA